MNNLRTPWWHWAFHAVFLTLFVAAFVVHFVYELHNPSGGIVSGALGGAIGMQLANIARDIRKERQWRERERWIKRKWLQMAGNGGGQKPKV